MFTQEVIPRKSQSPLFSKIRSEGRLNHLIRNDCHFGVSSGILISVWEPYRILYIVERLRCGAWMLWLARVSSLSTNQLQYCRIWENIDTNLIFTQSPKLDAPDTCCAFLALERLADRIYSRHARKYVFLVIIVESYYFGVSVMVSWI